MRQFVGRVATHRASYYSRPRLIFYVGEWKLRKIPSILIFSAWKIQAVGRKIGGLDLSGAIHMGGDKSERVVGDLWMILAEEIKIQRPAVLFILIADLYLPQQLDYSQREASPLFWQEKLLD